MVGAPRSNSRQRGQGIAVMAVGVLVLVATTMTATAQSAPAVPRQVDHLLSAPRHDPNPRLVDDLDRTVLLRGINVNSLAEYYQDDPALATVFPLTRDDFAGIAELGFNMVRLLVTWSNIEPERGVFDQAYIDQVSQAIEWAREFDIYVQLDMHQDAWGPTISTPDSEVCLPPLSAAVGWDGAPGWATFTDGLPTCKLALRELSPAVSQAWINFYANRDGIRDEFVKSWQFVAAPFVDDPIIAGYDLINEPSSGAALTVASTVLLGDLYAATIDGLRATEAADPAQMEHIVFFEPTGEWSALTVTATPLPTFTDDDNLVFAPHLYGGSITAEGELGVEGTEAIDVGYATAETVAGTYGVPFFSGEWGWFAVDAADAEAEVLHYGQNEDDSLIGGAWWSWKQACGDPHMFPVKGGPPNPVSQNLNRFSCPDQTPLGIPDEFARALGRPYPRAAPGVLTFVDSDPATGFLNVRGTGATGQQFDVWIPDLGTGAPTVTGTNVADIEVIAVPGGFRAVGTATGDWDLVATPGVAATVDAVPTVPASVPSAAPPTPSGSLPATGGPGGALALGATALALASALARGLRRRTGHTPGIDGPGID